MKCGEIYDIINPNSARTCRGFVIDKINKVLVKKFKHNSTDKGVKIYLVDVELLEGDLYRISPRHGSDEILCVTHLYTTTRCKWPLDTVIQFQLFSTVMKLSTTSIIQPPKMNDTFCMISGPYF
jgi:hypothetical protein